MCGSSRRSRGAGCCCQSTSTRISSTIATDNQYDQIAFTPGDAKAVLVDSDVFARLWEQRTAAEFRAYLRYYLSDHRPLWAEIAV